MLHLQWVEWVLLRVRKDNLAEMYCMGTETVDEIPTLSPHSHDLHPSFRMFLRCPFSVRSCIHIRFCNATLCIREYIQQQKAVPSVLGSANLEDSFITRRVMGNSVCSLFLHTCHALLSYLITSASDELNFLTTSHAYKDAGHC